MSAAAVAACAALLIATDAPVNVLPPRYASWNIDSSRDRLFFDADLASPQLARLMAGATLGNHSSLRFGGTGNDALFYGGIGGSPACDPTKPFVYECLNASTFDALLGLGAAADASIIFGVNIHPATGAPSPPKGPWDPTNARFLLAEAQRRGSPLSHLELGNEQNTLMTAQQQAAALAVLSGVLDELYGPAPGAPGRPLLVGPDTHSIHDAGSPNGKVLAYLADFVTATATLPLFAVTHHEYIEIDYLSVLNASFLDASALMGAQVVAAVRAASKSVEVWAGEIGPHNGGGGPTHTPTNCAGNRVCGKFGSAIWYADAMGSKAVAGYAKFCRQDAIGADYALLNATPVGGAGQWSFAPSPDFWLLALWTRLVAGAPGVPVRVLDARVPAAANKALRAYAFCQPGAPGSGAAATTATLLLINLAATPACVALPAFAARGANATLWALTPGAAPAGATPVESPDTLLNGVRLAADTRGALPALRGASVGGGGSVTLPPTSVSFVSVPLAAGALPACAAAPA